MRALLLLLLLLLPSSAWAQDEELAWRHFQRATRLFENRDFSQAVEEFQRAFLADHRRPWFIYNIGRSYERLAEEESDTAMALRDLRRAFVAYRDHYLAISQRLQLQALDLVLGTQPRRGASQMSSKPGRLERKDATLEAALTWVRTSQASPSDAPLDALPESPHEPPLPDPLTAPREPVGSPAAQTVLEMLPGGELDRALERQEQKMRDEEVQRKRHARWRRTQRAAGLGTLLPGVGMSVFGANLLGRLPALREQLAVVPQGTSTSELLPLIQRIERHSIASSVLLPVGLALVSVGVVVLVPAW